MGLWKQTLFLRAFSLAKVPLLLLVRPSVVKLTEKETIIKIPLGYMTKNHVQSMYFGALSMGADCAGGLFAMDYIRKKGAKINFLFKDFRADFIRRAEGDVHFINKDGSKIIRAVDQAIKTGERVNLPLHITATTPKISKNKPVAKFILTMSLKVRRS